AGSLRRYLEASQSANTLRAYRADWVAWSAWCATEGRQALPADALDVAVYLAAAADARREQHRHGWRALFAEFDAVVCPVSPTPAFPHDHTDWQTRRIDID
ncbi:hypothetical protein IU505_35125, partial [Nocardia nova]|nr:hypothetical protein [Nocardia nova]